MTTTFTLNGDQIAKTLKKMNLGTRCVGKLTPVLGEDKKPVKDKDGRVQHANTDYAQLVDLASGKVACERLVTGAPHETLAELVASEAKARGIEIDDISVEQKMQAEMSEMKAKLDALTAKK